MLPCPLGAGFFAFGAPAALGVVGGVAFFGCEVSSSEKDSQAVSRTVTGKTREREMVRYCRSKDNQKADDMDITYQNNPHRPEPASS